MVHRCMLSARFIAAVALVSWGIHSSIASAVTVFQNSGTNWSVAANWSGGVLPSGANDGEIPTGKIALGDGQLTGADIYVQNGGTLRVTSASQIVNGGVINVEGGGRLEYTIDTASGTVNTVNLLNGASIGRHVAATTPITTSTYDDIHIVGLNSEVHFQGTHPGGRFFNFNGALTGDQTSILYGENLGTNNGTIGIQSTTGNTYAGKTIIRSSNGITRGVLAVQGENPLGTGAAGAVEVQNMGIFRLRSNTGVTGTGVIQVQTGGRIEIDGTSGGNTIQLMNGSNLGRSETTFVTNTSTDTINIDAASTVTFAGMNSSRRLILNGLLTADAATTILIQNQGVNSGFFQFNANATSGINAQLIVSGTSVNDRGRLAANGTNALGSGMTNHVVVQNFGTLQIMDNAGLQSSTNIIEIQSGARVDFDATSSSGNRIQLANNTTIGRTTTSPTTSTTTDTIEIANNANVRIYGAIADPRELVLAGAISGNNVNISVWNEGQSNEEVRINSATGNALSGQITVEGHLIETSPTTMPGVFTPFYGVLGTQGVSPLGTMDVEIRDMGVVIARQGSLNNQPGVTVLDGGILRFRHTTASTWANSSLYGDGRVRAEDLLAQKHVDGTKLALTLNNVLVAPGTSAGTLTIEATTLSFDAASSLEIELGPTSDLLVVDGTLDLTSGPSLNLLALPGLEEGDYVIATYSGALTGGFGSIFNNLGAFAIDAIDYGILNPGSITVSISAIPPVPEPNSGLLALCGLAGLYVRRRKTMAQAS